jgi:hypothetical protein
MLHDLEALIGSSVVATDGEIGTVRNFLFDGLSWTIHYLVVDVGSWFKRRDVVLPIAAVDPPDWAQKTFHVHLTKEQVGNSPDVDTKNRFFASKQSRWKNTLGNLPVGRPHSWEEGLKLRLEGNILSTPKKIRIYAAPGT